ncbi:MAG: DUF1109 family protein, partial [Rhizobiales bacterium]|nr:DUF1109 family protein [Hyphomicrobiales bacterium]
MRTDDLIRALAQDGQKGRPPGRALSMALVASLPVALLLFLVILGPRPDFATALENLRFPLKFVLTLALAVPALA